MVIIAHLNPSHMIEGNQSVETVLTNILALNWCPDYRTYYQVLEPAITRLREQVGEAALNVPIDSEQAIGFEEKLRRVLKTVPTRHVVCGVREDSYRWVVDEKALNDVIANVRAATSSTQA